MIIEESSNIETIGQIQKQLKTDKGENDQQRNIIPLDDEEILLPKKSKTQLTLSNKKSQKPVSPYIIFLKNYKTKYKDVNFKDLAKVWREMPTDEKQIYYDISSAEAEKMKEHQQNNDDQIEEEHKIEKENESFSFPIARVKGILKQDEDNKIIKKSNLYLIEQMVQIFGKELLELSYTKMQESKRKTLMKGELYNAILTDKRFAFLASTGILKELGGDKLGQKSKNKLKQKESVGEKEEKQQKNSIQVEKKEKLKPAISKTPKNNLKIDSFFKKI